MNTATSKALKERQSSLCDVVKQGWRNDVSEILDKDPELLAHLRRQKTFDDCQDEYSPVHESVQYGHPEITQMLVKTYGLPVDSQTLYREGRYVNSRTPLHASVITNSPAHTDCTKILLENGAEINKEWTATDGSHFTALHIVGKYGYDNLVPLLLKHGADGNKTGERKHRGLTGTPAEWAKYRNMETTAKLIISEMAKHDNGGGGDDSVRVHASVESALVTQGPTASGQDASGQDASGLEVLQLKLQIKDMELDKLRTVQQEKDEEIKKKNSELATQETQLQNLDSELEKAKKDIEILTEKYKQERPEPYELSKLCCIILDLVHDRDSGRPNEEFFEVDIKKISETFPGSKVLTPSDLKELKKEMSNLVTDLNGEEGYDGLLVFVLGKSSVILE